MLAARRLVGVVLPLLLQVGRHWAAGWVSAELVREAELKLQV